MHKTVSFCLQTIFNVVNKFHISLSLPMFILSFALSWSKVLPKILCKLQTHPKIFLSWTLSKFVVRFFVNRAAGKPSL